MTGTEHLSAISFAAAVAFALPGLLSMFRAGPFARGLAAFPRSRLWGIVLTAAGLIWSALLIQNMTLGEIGKYKWTLVILTPVSFFLIIQYLEELLASRALGGLLMLAPVAMVDAARWHPSPWRLVVVSVAYAMVVIGMWLMLCPFKFRIWTSTLFERDGRRRLASAILLIIAALLAVSGVMTA